MEWNDYDNWTRGAAMRAACAVEDLVFTIWLTRDFSAVDARRAVENSQATGILLEGEIPAESAPATPNPQAVDWEECIGELSGFDIFKGVVTNMAPFTHHNGTPYSEIAAPLIADGWSCHTECYDLDGDPRLWIERRDFFAKQLGWPVTQPAIGLYGGRTMADFPTFDKYANGSVWAAEYVLN